MLHRSQRMTTTLTSRLQSTCKHAYVDEGGLRTLKEAYSRQKPEVQCAFKILMIHEVLQFALRIAFRCVLHRCGSQDIHC